MKVYLKNVTDSDLDLVELGETVQAGEAIAVNSADIPDSVLEYINSDTLTVVQKRNGSWAEVNKNKSLRIVMGALGEIPPIVDTDVDERLTDLRTEIQDIIGSAPETLNTLQEIAAALGGDANFASNIMSALDDKSDKDHSHLNMVTVNDLNQAIQNHSHSGYALVDHVHIDLASSSHLHDDRYSLKGHTHDFSYEHNHDDRYYDKNYINNKFNNFRMPEYFITYNPSRVEVVQTDWYNAYSLGYAPTQLIYNTPGTYKVSFAYNYNCRSTTNDAEVRLIATNGTDGTQIVHEFKSEQNDSSYDQKLYMSGFGKVDLTARTNFYLQIRSGPNAVRMQVWNFTLEVYKVL